MRSPTSTTFSSSKGADTVGEYDDVIDGEAMELNMVVGMEESQRCCSRCCCEGCCDVRRATIIINLIMAVVAVISIILITVTEMSIQADLEELDDYVAKQMYDGITSDVRSYLKLANIVTLARLPFLASGIYGALKYKTLPVQICIGSNIIELLLSVSIDSSMNGFNFFNLIIGAAVTGLWTYPMVLFVGQVKKGIMSDANYPLVKVRRTFCASRIGRDCMYRGNEACIPCKNHFSILLVQYISSSVLHASFLSAPPGSPSKINYATAFLLLCLKRSSNIFRRRLHVRNGRPTLLWS